MRKKVLSALLMLSMAFAILTRMNIPTQAAETFIYNPGKTPWYPIINLEMSEDTKLLRDYGKTQLNLAGNVGMIPNMAMKSQYEIDLDNVLVGMSNTVTFTDYATHVRFGATFQGDKHKSISYHPFDSQECGARMVVNTTASTMILDGPRDDLKKDMVFTTYSGSEFGSLGNRGYMRIRVGLSPYSDCGCGSPKFGSPFFNFADLSAPTITGWYVTLTENYGDKAPDPINDKMNIYPDLTDDSTDSWQDVYIHLQFSEKIRFADDENIHDNVYLGLDLTNSVNNQSAGKTFYAKMYALRENIISFKLDTSELVDPSSVNYLNGMDPNHYITGFSDIIVTDDIQSSTAQNALKADDAYRLQHILYGDHVIDYEAANTKSSNKKPTLQEYLAIHHTKSDSLFTDLVGNACATTTLTDLTMTNYRVILDARHPYVEDLKMEVYDQYWQLQTVAGTNGDPVDEYMKEGYHVRFHVKMSEDTNYFKNPKAVTNMKDADGNNIVLDCTRYYMDDELVMYGGYAQTYYQYDLTVTTDMLPPTDKDGTAVPITIIGLQDDIEDLVGNVIVNNPQTGEFLPAVDKQLKVDTIPPIIEINHDRNERGEYIPQILSEEGRVFYIDFNLSDPTDHGLDHASGLVSHEGIDARVILYESNSHPNSGQNYQYAITSFGQEPSDSDFKSGVTKITNLFAQVTSDRVNAPHRLYVKLPDNFPLAGLPITCKIITRDAVGHTAEKEFVIDATVLTDLLDHASPEVTMKESEISFDSTSNQGGLEVSFSVSDGTLVDSETLAYAFIDGDGRPLDSDWINVKLTEAITDASTIEVSGIRYPGTLSTGAKKISFYVYAEDTTKNRNGTVHGPFVFDYDKDYLTHIAVVEEKTPLSNPSIDVTYTGDVKSDGVNENPAGMWAWALYRPMEPENYFGKGGLFSDPDTYLLTKMWVSNDNNASVNIINPGLISMQDPDNRRCYYGKFDTETLTFTLTDEGVNYDELANIFDGRYYGKMEVRYYLAQYLLMMMNEDGKTGYLGFMEGNNVFGVPYESPIYRSPVYEIWYAGYMYNKDYPTGTANKEVTTVNVSWETMDALVPAAQWTPASGEKAAMYSLSDQVLRVSLTPIFEDAFGLDLLDKERSVIQVVETDEHGRENILYEEHIQEADMSIVLPKDYVEGETADGEEALVYSDGINPIKVRITVFLTDANGETVERKTLEFDQFGAQTIYTDHNELIEFGIGAVVTHVNNNTGWALPDDLAKLTETKFYGYTYDNPILEGGALDRIDPAVHAPYDRPEKLVLNSYAPAGQGVTFTHAVVFTENAYYGSGETEYLQVSNTTDGVTHTGVWTNDMAITSQESGAGSYYNVVVYDSVEALNAAHHAPKDLPVVANQDNIISYRKVRANGLQSPVYTFIIYPDTTTNETVVDILPEDGDVLVQGVKGSVVSGPVGGQIYRYNHEASAWEQIPAYGFELTPTLDSNGFYRNEVFYGVDAEGNVTFTSAKIPDNYWIEKPVLTVSDEYVSETLSNVVSFDIHASYGKSSDYLTKYGAKLHVSFDSSYAAVIGVDSLTYDLPAADTWSDLNGNTSVYRFRPDDSNRKTGIFDFVLSSSGSGDLTITDMRMVHKYNQSYPGNYPEDVTLTFTLEDAAGNLSEPVLSTVRFKNTEPEFGYISMTPDVAYTPVSGQTSRMFTVSTLYSNIPVAQIYPTSNAGLADDMPGGYTNHPIGTITNPDIYRDGNFGWYKHFTDEYQSGETEITVVDMFGNVYRETVPVEAYTFTGTSGTNYGLDMDIQFSEPVNGKVTMSYASLDSRIFVDIAQVSGTLPPALTVGTSSASHDILATKVNQAVLEIDADKPVLILVYDPDLLTENTLAYWENGFDHILIPECVQRPVNGEIYWYFEEFDRALSTSEIAQLKMNGTYDLPATTNENVTAYVVTDKYAEYTGGSSYTFVYGGEREYTFTFRSLAGVDGQVTASLDDIPITITEAVANPGDTERPDFSLDIYGKYSMVYESANSYSMREWDESGTPVEKAILDIGYVQGYMLDFTVTDSSPAKLVILAENTSLSGLTYANAVSDSIPGVSIRGNQVLVDEAVAFSVVIIDASDNITAVNFSEDHFSIDKTPPYVLDQIDVSNGYYGKTVYVLLTDDQTPGDVTLIAPSGIAKETSGYYTDYYPLTFAANGTQNITFRDKAGNIASADITVSDIDNTKAAVTGIRWIPSNGSDTTLPPVSLTNNNVVAFVQFNTPIKELTVADAINSFVELHVETVFQNDQAVLTFKNPNRIYDNVNNTSQLHPWNLTLSFTAVNGAQNTYQLSLDPIIDKDAPYFHLSYDNSVPAAYVDVSITGLSEDCYLSGDGNDVKRAGVDITRRITENGHYSFVFTDMAGNQSRKDINIDCIDNTPPVILVDMPDSTAPTKDSITVRATMDEAGEMLITDQHQVVRTVEHTDGTSEVIIDGTLTPVNGPVRKDTDGDGVADASEFNWIEYEVTENGGYRVVAVDKVGRITETYFAISNIDKTAPSISFAPATVTIIQGTPVNDVKKLLSTGVSAWDNRSLSENLTVTYDSSQITEELLERVGVFTVTYTARDEAGNEATDTRFVKVFSANDIQVTLNGQKTFRSEITLLKSDAVTLQVSNLPGGDGEPYSVYLRVGRWKEGQLKTRAELLTDVTTGTGGEEYYSFTAEKNKYYTVYIVTQSRGTYITHFYVQ